MKFLFDKRNSLSLNTVIILITLTAVTISVGYVISSMFYLLLFLSIIYFVVLCYTIIFFFVNGLFKLRDNLYMYLSILFALLIIFLVKDSIDYDRHTIITVIDFVGSFARIMLYYFLAFDVLLLVKQNNDLKDEVDSLKVKILKKKKKMKK